MKKLLFYLPVFIFLTAFTCDDEPLDSDIDTSFNTPNTGFFTGDWEAVTFDTMVTTLTDFDGQEFTSVSDIEGENFDYIISFASDTYTTSGSYDLKVVVSINGEAQNETVQSYENVSGFGSYSVNGNTMTVSGTFFEYEFDGMESSALGGEQEAEFVLSDNGQTMTFNQNQEIIQNAGGIQTVTTVTSTTVLHKL